VSARPTDAYLQRIVDEEEDSWVVAVCDELLRLRVLLSGGCPANCVAKRYNLDDCTIATTCAAEPGIIDRLETIHGALSTADCLADTLKPTRLAGELLAALRRAVET
jgi:hypothetical protein